MALIRQSFSSTLQNFLAGSAALPVASGGTGATTAADARTALGLGSLATLSSPVPIANGGTGTTTAALAFAAIVSQAESLGNPGYLKLRNGLIVQWGRGTLGANSTGTITYPTAFSSFSICVAGGGTSSVGTADQVRRYGAATTTGAGITNPDDSSNTYEWLAVGV